MIKSLNQLIYIQRGIVKFRWLIYTRLWGMNIKGSSIISTSAKLDRTYPKGVNIGEKTYIAFGASILTHDFVTGRKVGTHIGSNCFIGARSIVLPGVRVGNNCIVGAGSVVTRDVPPFNIVAGNPARIIRRDAGIGEYGRLVE